MLQITKEMTRAWMEHAYAACQRYVNETPDKSLEDFDVFVARFIYTFVHALRELGDDEEARTQITESVANGIVFAIMQVLLNTTPPDFGPRTETVN